MSFLRLLPLGWQIGIYAAIIAAAIAAGGAALGVFVHHERLIGWNGALAQVAKQDAHAMAIAGAVARDVTECEQAGGSFDVSMGDCAK